MKPEATASICTRTLERMSPQQLDKVVFGAGPNVRRKSTGSFLIHNSECLEAIIMNEHRTIHLVEIPIGGKGGFVWNRLHEEREEICEALLKDPGPVSERSDKVNERKGALQ